MKKNNIVQINEDSAWFLILQLRERIKHLDQMYPKAIIRAGIVGKQIRDLLIAIDELQSIKSKNDFSNRSNVI